LHLANPVQAGAVAPPDLLPGRPDGAGAIDRLEKPQVARAHQERPIPVEPQLVMRLQVGAERGTARNPGSHTGRGRLDYARKAIADRSREPTVRRHGGGPPRP